MSFERRIEKMNKHAAPKFAMSFTQDAVCLELKQGTEWKPLGEAPFAHGDLAVRLNALRANEAGTDRDHTDTVLVIPDDQVLYVTLPVSDGAETLAELSEALERMTPYSASELAFDWCRAANGDLDSLRVAAVARRTLEEAEEFAIAQGFQPSGFIARPGDQRFDGQPDFGPSALSHRKQPLRPFSHTELHQVDVAPTSAEPVEEAPVLDAKPDPLPVISRVVPHVVADEPPVAEAPVAAAAPVVQEAADSGLPVIDAPSDDFSAEDKAAVPLVIRHGDRGNGRPNAAAPRIDARARALHERAAEARAARQASQTPEDAAPVAGSAIAALRARRPGAFATLLGLLVVGLLIVLLVFGGDRGADQIAETPAPETPASVAAPVAEDVAAAPIEPAPAAVIEEQPEPAPTPDLAEPPPVEPAPVAPDLTAQPSDVATPVLPEAAPVAEAPDTVAAEDIAGTAADQTATEEAPVEDALTAALREAMGATAANATAEPQPGASPAPVASPPAQSTAATPAPPAAPAVTAPAVATPAATTRLNASARPRSAPVRAEAPAADSRPAVPANPQPAAAAAPPAAVSTARPQARPASATRTTTPPATPAVTPPTPAAQPAIGTSPRPPARPARSGMLEEGSATETARHVAPTAEEITEAKALLRDLRTAQAGSRGLSEAERGALIVLADARPTRKPVAVSSPSQAAVTDAVAAAVAGSDRPGTRATTSTAPQASASGRPAPRPSSVNGRGGPAAGAGPGSASLASAAINDAVASAVSANPATARPGAVALTALGSSALPPRRSSRASQVAAAAPIASLAPAGQDAARGAATAVPAPTPVASAPQPSAAQQAAAQQASEQAALAEQRRQDAELQAQAEARARARAAADAQAEAQARAQAEARARAQADAEARAARSRQQSYTPPEAESEPEVAAAAPQGGQTPASVASAATVSGGIQINRTQIIGTVGAGKASRALVRLSNGRIITLRLGDKINGGTITEIGDSKIVYSKSGRPHQLSVLGGQ